MYKLLIGWVTAPLRLHGVAPGSGPRGARQFIRKGKPLIGRPACRTAFPGTIQKRSNQHKKTDTRKCPMNPIDKPPKLSKPRAGGDRRALGTESVIT
ncbi:hypothetical protein EGJ27_11305 [Pseudomonas sp. v388]|nr:hypothetical protein EGJ27_11305 [Pseudomonas sp. v388]